ncbi:hypothetical protein [Phenylobacterium sp.]|uniref:hypothetical protein n=1 Tax=Phenylobacterium sp. TaxID=1871053 RepID=UPI00289CB5D3|nr:hypothetical protein [Phenylobacterium sp.]
MYKSIASADGWFFMHPNVVAGSRPVTYALAMWALPEEGEPVGLVVLNSKTGPAKIATVPPVAGRYLHRDELTPDQLGELLGSLRSCE